MSHNVIMEKQSDSAHTNSGLISNGTLWKKNLKVDNDFTCSLYPESDHHSVNPTKFNTTTENCMLSRQGEIVPGPIYKGMNSNYHPQRQPPSNATANHKSDNETVSTAPRAIAHPKSLPPLNFNNVALMPNSNQTSNHPQQGHNTSAGGRRPVSANSNNADWLQHMILNPINPLQSNPNSTGNNAGGSGTINNQANGYARQWQHQGNIHGNVDNGVNHQHHISTQQGDKAIGVTPIAKSISKQQQQQQQLQQQLQQQQNLQQQLKPLNELASHLQLPSRRQTQQLQQHQAVATSNSNQMVVLPATVSPPASTQQFQQQQLLLLALMLQQNNTNKNGSNVDTSSLSAALSSPEGLRLINSFLMGQQLPPLQENQVQHQPQQQQPAIHLSQNGNAFSGPAGSGSTPSSSNLNTYHLPSFPVLGIQEDAPSNYQHLFLSQQSQQPQSQALSQPLHLHGIQPKPVSFLNPTLSSSLNPSMLGNTRESSIRNAANNLHFPSPTDTITNLTMPSHSESMLTASETSDGKVPSTIDGCIGFSGSSIKNGNNNEVNKPPAVKSQFPRLLYCESDDAILGEYQTLLRQQLELFEADSHDVINGTFRQGRTTPIRLGQIGLRCTHCSKALLSVRTKGSVYFSQTIKGMYQIGQNMSKVHLCERCPRLPPDIKKRMITLRNRRHRASGGRAYWIRHLRELGIYEDGTVLRAHPLGKKKKPPNERKQAS